ncbi:MAG: MFS transporter [Clostridia bacterium]|nr:MFS transporter [Clostridia bacterium]
MDNKYELKKAIQIGSVSVFSYMASYYMRNILSVSTPAMLEAGTFTKEFVGTLSSVYFLVYAIGQLINGVIGDTAKPRIMVSGGLISCGIVSVLFAFTDIKSIQILFFAIMGFALSMLRGPLVKTISENTLPGYARTCCVFFSFSSFLGPLIASLLSIMFNWRMTFIVSGISVIVIGICAFAVLTIMENKKIITFSSSKKSKGFKNVFEVFKLDKFLFYMFVGALVEISMTSIGFWIPTYLSERLGFSTEMANITFSVINIAKASTPFLALLAFRSFKENDVKMTKYCFIFATLLFIGVLLITNRYLNILLFLLALMAVGGASALLWSIYIPSQGESGLVSTINGVLDFSGYAAASAANMVFSYTMSSIGWNGIIAMWIVLMISGIAATFFVKSKKTALK